MLFFTRWKAAGILLTALVVNVKRMVKLLGAKKSESLDSMLPVRAELAVG